MPVRAPSTTAPSTTSSRSNRPRPIDPPPKATFPPPPAPRRRCWPCRPAPTSPRAGRCPSATTRRPVADRSAPEQADAAVLALADGQRPGGCDRLHGRRVAADPATGRLRPSSNAPRTSPRRAEPLGTMNNSTSAPPRSPTSPGSDRGRGGTGGRPAGRSRADRQRQRLAHKEGADGPIHPTPVIGMVGRLPEASPAGRTRLHRGGRRDRPRRPLRAVARRPRARKLPGEPAARRPCAGGVPAIVAMLAAVRGAVRSGRR